MFIVINVILFLLIGPIAWLVISEMTKRTGKLAAFSILGAILFFLVVYPNNIWLTVSLGTIIFLPCFLLGVTFTGVGHVKHLMTYGPAESLMGKIINGGSFLLGVIVWFLALLLILIIFFFALLIYLPRERIQRLATL